MAPFDFGGNGSRSPSSGQAGAAPDSGVPVAQVNAMKRQGLSDNQIVEALQREGFKTHQIFDAMNQAELVPGSARQLDDLPTGSPGGPQIFSSPPQPTYPGQQPEAAQYEPAPVEAPAAQPVRYPLYPPQPMTSGEGLSPDQIEEIAEAIIEEKWAELSKGVSKIVEWKDRTEARLTELEQTMIQLQQNFESLHRGVLGKLTEYDRNIGSVGTDIKAMQKVFQQMLPTFTENINELSRLTKNIKSK